MSAQATTQRSLKMPDIRLQALPLAINFGFVLSLGGSPYAGLAFTSFENQTEVVGRHLDSLGQCESGASSNG